ncbi:peptidase S8/S53 domain-containing protein [Leucosporidium creatinivorum]|uniref:Peptidase S8/S53 domain-containing protein n=1 Tax=Leucosporidium creatinivorum TaxID=106004 RepID=A0A1Y2F649_9BASI|nr:peptidase S8/S53 domain-containing protein [Leucosporidium creatinivorum]
MTGVNKLHDEGYYGKGSIVGILDTGVDYNHPALGGGFGPGYKIAGGYDFAGDGYNGVSNFTISPDSDPYANAVCGGHGTHVAGIVGANSTAPYPIFTGVVPEATIYAYKIFGCTDAASGLSYSDDELIISGLLQAYEDRADVITLSLGGPSGWSESPSSAVASALVEQGRVVTVAQGNDGAVGTFYGAAPASGKNVWAIGSVDNIGLVGYEATIANSTNFTSFPYFASVPLGFTSLPLYAITLDSSSNNTGDACSALSSSLDLSGYVVLVKRGTCTFAEKYAVVAAAGAKHLIIYNSAAAFSYLPDASAYLESTAIVSAETGASLVALAAANSSALISAVNSTVLAIEYDSAGRISEFSSYGPNFEMDQPSPAFSAPGGEILSTWPLDGGGFSILSGTSMATPFTAGAAALYLSVKGKQSASALEMRDIFIATSSPVSNYSGSEVLESVVHQGGGLINVYDAINQPVRISPGFLLLNDTRNFNAIHKITVKNMGDSSVKLKISHEAAGTTLSFVEGSKVLHNSWPVPLVDSAATVLFSRTELSLGARKSATFLATFIPPIGLDPALAPLYSGYIKIGANLTVPYYGLAAPLKGLQILDDTSDVLGVDLPTLIGADDNVIPKSTTNTTVSLSSKSSAIQIVFRLATGTRFFSLDVVNASTTIHPAFTKRSMLEHGDTRLHKAVKKGLLPLVDGLVGGVVEVANNLTSSLLGGASSSSRRALFGSLGTLQTQDYAYRNAEDSPTDYYYVAFNGTVAPTSGSNLSATNLEPGKYKLLLRALKLTGDLKTEGDYETWLSPPIQLVK